MSEVRSVEECFGELIELGSAELRREYLERIGAENMGMRQQLEQLMAAHQQASSFLQNEGLETTLDVDSGTTGTQIGPYKLRERLGAGGMGVVWAAEQKVPLKRKVALKLIKPGMDSEQVIARFEAEREALSRMDHPNVARVLDAGKTELGLPYFVMELIRGVPITEYCDSKRLTIPERLKLFVTVCGAIQHAHQKGIIHRDIKPSNVLVSEQDGQAVPKVIDFGVAKALHQPLTDYSLYTGVFQALGTLQYMSPEQAGLSISDVDTRADVYGLGVLLYELLTGSTPFEKEQLASAAFDEALRMIREQEPPRPSNRLSTHGDRARSISQTRNTDPKQLTRLVRGDLDWIVTKSLDKDRNRRYESANSFAADINRYLDNEPIVARPPSVTYKLTRFYQRNRGAVLIAHVLFVFAMVLGALAIRSFVIERRLAEQHRNELWERVLFKVMSGSPESSSAIADAEQSQVDFGKIELLRGIENLFSGKPGETIRTLQPIADANHADIPANALLAMAHYQAGSLWNGIAYRDRVSSNEPETDLDYLLLAYCALGVDGDGSERAAEYLTRSMTPLGFLVQAEVAAWTFASSENPMEAVKLAQESLRSARPYLMDTAFRVQVELEVNFFAYLMAEHLGVDSEEYLSVAQLAAETMESRYPDYVWGRFLCGELWSSTREFSRVEKVWDVPGNDFLTANFGIAQIQQDKITESTIIAPNIRDPLLRLFVFPALIQSDDGKKILRKAFGEVVALAETRIEYREPYVLAIGRFAGIDEQELAATAGKWLDTWTVGGDWSDWNRKCTEYFVDPDREKLYDGDERGTYWELSLFYIGLYELADGNVVPAEEYFQRLNQEAPSASAVSTWSRCLVEQLQKGPVREALQR